MKLLIFLGILGGCVATFSEPFRQFLREKYGDETEKLLSRTDVGGGGSYGGGGQRPGGPTG